MFSDKTREQIEKQFGEFVQKFPELGKEVRDRIEAYGGQKEKTGIAGEDVQTLLGYLYANMPLSDAMDYPFDTFLEYAEHGAMLMNNGIWNWKTAAEEEGDRERAERMFLDSVVFHRVNTEGITPCRRMFYKELKERVAGKGLKDAILEVNYWCAEEVTYQCSDDRTLSAEAVYRSGTGRCGEESVFTVNALRSVGIPARQVYAHRWAHCDDNHAWVEVWCGGRWHYLGACEPKDVLDKGWFTGAASRAMMINSRVYGNQKQDAKNVVESRDMTTAYSELGRYARTVRFSLLVEDDQNRIVPGADVSCELLNYAELVPVIQGTTDDNGVFEAESGAGSLMISVRKGQLEGSCVMDLCSETKAAVTLTEKDLFYKDDEWVSFDMTAPVESQDLFEAGHPEGGEQPSGTNKTELKERRRKAEASEKYKSKMRTLGNPPGNEEEIRRFLEDMPGDISWKKIFIRDLAEKDRKDSTAEVLQDHFEDAMQWKDCFPEEIFRRYILAPRIGNEQPSAYRKAVREYFTEEDKEQFRRSPAKVRCWIDKNIREYPQEEYQELTTLPGGMLRCGFGSGTSREVLFTAICRTFGIPAELDPVEGRAYALGEPAVRSIPVRFMGRDGEKWSYGQNWTVSRKLSGGWKTLRLRGNIEEDGTAFLQQGEYRVITANRLPGGSQFAAVMRFYVNEGEKKTVHLNMRSAGVDDLLMKIPLPEFTLERGNGEMVSVRNETTLSGALAFVWLDEGKEPSEHILNEIMENAGEFAGLGKRLKFVFREKNGTEDRTFRQAVRFLPEAEVYYDADNQNQIMLARRMYKDPGALPFLLIADRTMTGVYAESGYNVGTGEMMLRIMDTVMK